MSDEPSPSPSQDPDPGPAPGEIIAGKYVVESRLGMGGMGVVLAARHMHLNQRVAIKVLRKESNVAGSSTSRFLREARAAAAITSEHVARVLDVGTLETGLPFIVMEHLSGSDLAALVEMRGRLPYAEAVDLVLQACEAIAEAHSLGIIHRTTSSLRTSSSRIAQTGPRSQRSSISGSRSSKTPSPSRGRRRR